MKSAVYNIDGKKSKSTLSLSDSVFAIDKIDHSLIRQAYDRHLSNKRQNYAVTKTRGDVRGGGRKPWKQKGTGRARFGSSRVPIWRGGGVAFGPTGIENYKKKMPTLSKKRAMKHALSISTGKIKVLNNLSIDSGKTKDASAFISNMTNDMATKRSVLICVDDFNKETALSFRNIPGITIVSSKSLNVFDVINADFLLFDTKTIKTIEDHLSAVTEKNHIRSMPDD